MCIVGKETELEKIWYYHHVLCRHKHWVAQRCRKLILSVSLVLIQEDQVFLELRGRRIWLQIFPKGSTKGNLISQFLLA